MDGVTQQKKRKQQKISPHFLIKFLESKTQERPFYEILIALAFSFCLDIMPFFNTSQIFQANNNSFAVHRNTFEKPLVTRYIRVNPRTWENAICLRLEVFGCDGKSIKQSEVFVIK